jgi:hypothetical protein
MSNAVEYFQWWFYDESTGERRLTRYKLNRADASRAFPGAEPDTETRDVRTFPDRHPIATSGADESAAAPRLSSAETPRASRPLAQASDR